MLLTLNGKERIVTEIGGGWSRFLALDVLHTFLVLLHFFVTLKVSEGPEGLEGFAPKDCCMADLVAYVVEQLVC